MPSPPGDNMRGERSRPLFFFRLKKPVGTPPRVPTLEGGVGGGGRRQLRIELVSSEDSSKCVGDTSHSCPLPGRGIRVSASAPRSIDPRPKD